MAKRIQWSHRGFGPLPEDAVLVSRASRFGNPFRIGTAEMLALKYINWLDGDRVIEHTNASGRTMRYDPGWVRSHLCDLVGRDLACACPLEEPCHADELLRRAAALERQLQEVAEATCK